MNLEQAPRYQPDENIKKRKLGEFRIINKIFGLLPYSVRILDCACAEGFLVYLAGEALQVCTGIEIDPKRVERGRKWLHLGRNIVTGDIFKRITLFEHYDTIIFSRFLHNISETKARRLMDAVSKKEDCILIIKYKPGMIRESGEKRERLATKEGVKQLMEEYDFAKKSFPQEVIVAAKGKYIPVLYKLRKNIGEG